MASVSLSTSPGSPQSNLDECQEAIGYRFHNLDRLRSALTHTSGADTRSASFERLEFLGDAVLGLITCERLFDRFPDLQEGDMTKIKSAVVSRSLCAKFSQELGLGHFLITGKGLRAGTDLPSNVLADVFESLVAAIYLDGGFETAKAFVLCRLNPEIERVARDATHNNHKSHLQQVAQRMFGGTPRYIVLDEQGPDHSRSFKVAVMINDQRFAAAWGRNKKIAESMAAENALAMINGVPIPHDHD